MDTETWEGRPKSHQSRKSAKIDPWYALLTILESTQFKMEEYDHKIKKIVKEYERKLEKEKDRIQVNHQF